MQFWNKKFITRNYKQAGETEDQISKLKDKAERNTQVEQLHKKD